MLATLQQIMMNRFDALESKVDLLMNKTLYLEERLDDLCAVLVGDTTGRCVLLAWETCYQYLKLEMCLENIKGNEKF